MIETHRLKNVVIFLQARLDTIVCNNKQRWNNNKCWSEWKELIDKGMCDKWFIWNPSNCEYECDKSWDVGEYLDYKDCKCRKRLIDKLVEECSENINGNEMIYNGTLNDHGKICNFCTVYIVLLAILFISISISSVFIYFHWYIKTRLWKQQFIKHINGKCQRNIKNQTHYFFDDMVNISDYDSNLLKIGKKLYKNIDIYYIGCITMKDSDYASIHSVNPFVLDFW